MSMLDVLRPSAPALVAPIVLVLPSTVTVVKPSELPALVPLTSPPCTVDLATFAEETPSCWLMTREQVASTKMAARTAE